MNMLITESLDNCSRTLCTNVSLLGIWKIRKLPRFYTHTQDLEAVARMCSVKKGVLKDFSKFTGKQLCQSLFFNDKVGITVQLY